jgi:hypothetical protein
VKDTKLNDTSTEYEMSREITGKAKVKYLELTQRRVGSLKIFETVLHTPLFWEAPRQIRKLVKTRLVKNP